MTGDDEPDFDEAGDTHRGNTTGDETPKERMDRLRSEWDEDVPSNADLERFHECVRYGQIGCYEVGETIYCVEVWNHENTDAPALFGTETTSEDRARRSFDDLPIDATVYDVFLYRASVTAVGDDVSTALTVDNWSSTEEPVLVSDVEVLARRPPSANQFELDD